MAKEKVLLVHNFYQIGGGEHTVFENEKNLLLENAHEVYTYTRSNDELKTEPWKLALLPFTTTWSFKTYFEVRKLIREKGIDIVHCHNTFPLISPSVYYAARSLKVPVIQTIHNFRFLCPNGFFYCNRQTCEKCREQQSFLPALKNRCYRNSVIQTLVLITMLKIHRWLGTYKKINYIFLMEFSKSKFAELIDIYGANVFVKPNYVNKVDVGTVDRTRKAKFIYAGRLEEDKGVPFLLEEWVKLPKTYELHIYGDGVYREACENVARDNPNIRYLGFCPQKQIFTDLADATALVFPSTSYEGFPMILAESFSVGKPVVCADERNHGDIVQAAGAGVLYEVGNSAEFCAAVEKVYAENANYSQMAEKYFSNYLTKEKNYEILSDIYDKAKHIS